MRDNGVGERGNVGGLLVERARPRASSDDIYPKVIQSMAYGARERFLVVAGML